MIVGTIRNSVNLLALNSKWELKKQGLGSQSKEEMTADERLKQFFEDQAYDMRESKSQDAIDAKLMSGEKLTQEEIEYLRRTNPQALKDYEDQQLERASYKKRLQSCKSKEEVERVKTLKMGEALASCKKIANDANIPKSEKKRLLEELVMKTTGIGKDHNEFLQSSRYASLPETDDEARKKEHQDFKEEIQDAPQNIESQKNQEEEVIEETDQTVKRKHNQEETSSKETDQTVQGNLNQEETSSEEIKQTDEITTTSTPDVPTQISRELARVSAPTYSADASATSAAKNTTLDIVI